MPSIPGRQMTFANSPQFLPASVSRDADFIVWAQVETMQLSYAPGPSPYTKEQLYELLVEALNNLRGFISMLFLGTQVIGYYWYEQRPSGIAFILDLFVDKRFRHKGFGKYMLHTILLDARSRRCTSAKLAVSVNNAAALSLYASCGFKEVGQTKRGTTLWLEMALDLQD